MDTTTEREDLLLEALLNPVFQFMNALENIDDEYFPESGKIYPKKYLKEFHERLPQFKNTIFESVFLGYAAGFDTAVELFANILPTEDKESSDDTATTETTK